MPLNRLEAFSDGVFAIVITVLVFNLQIPTPADESARALVDALLDQWPVYLGYALSFVLIGSTWVNHHQMLRYIVRADHTLLMLNVLLMMWTAVIPFTTALMAEFLRIPGQQNIGAAVFGGSYAVGGVFYNLLWWYAVWARHTDPALLPAQLKRITLRYFFGPTSYFLGAVLALFSVVLGLLVYVLPTLLYVLPDWSARQGEVRNGAD